MLYFHVCISFASVRMRLCKKPGTERLTIFRLRHLFLLWNQEHIFEASFFHAFRDFSFIPFD